MKQNSELNEIYLSIYLISFAIKYYCEFFYKIIN